jgi:bifunctional UDP-N-acetylglucosamine pyrophosphorylase / glucosamine-1-phosphate N-acetyltransferase
MSLYTTSRVISLGLMTKAVVLAAGRGSRLHSPTPKVLHKIFDKPVLAWVLDTLAEVEVDEIIVVCGYKSQEVESFLHAYPVTTVIQSEQLGTGHALQIASKAIGDYDGSVLVVNGDCPLIESTTINTLLQQHQENILDLSFLSCDLDKPYGYGRVIRKGSEILAIKEEKDCSEAEKNIKEINAGVYAFEWQTISPGLQTLSNNNSQEEYYLTDLVSWAYSQGLATGTHTIHNPYEVMGINTREDLALVWKLKNEANLEQLMLSGVTIVDPVNTMISPDVDIGQDTVIYPGTYIHRRVVIGEGCEIGPNTTIFGPAEIGARSTVIQSHISRSSIGENSTIGPFAHIRAGSDIGSQCKVGSFVEVKNSSFGDETMVSHLSYIGDAKLKNNVNIGAGTIIANYDHRTGKKAESTINSNASTGANSVIVSPVVIGSGATVAAGSVITKDVPENNIAVARARQENLVPERKLDPKI